MPSAASPKTVGLQSRPSKARSPAPFTADEKDATRWMAGGNSLWYQDKGWNITSGDQWKKVYTLPDAGKTFTAVSFSGNRVLATWCGPCNNSGFTLLPSASP